MHKMNPDIPLMCELHGTVKMYRAACSLSHVDSHFHTIQNNTCWCNFFVNVCTTAQHYIDTKVRISNGKPTENLRNLVGIYYLIVSVHLLETFGTARRLNMKFWK